MRLTDGEWSIPERHPNRRQQECLGNIPSDSNRKQRFVISEWSTVARFFNRVKHLSEHRHTLNN